MFLSPPSPRTPHDHSKFILDRSPASRRHVHVSLRECLSSFLSRFRHLREVKKRHRIRLPLDMKTGPHNIWSAFKPVHGVALTAKRVHCHPVTPCQKPSRCRNPNTKSTLTLQYLAAGSRAVAGNTMSRLDVDIGFRVVGCDAAAHPLLDLTGHSQEGLLDVARILCRSLKERDA